MLCNKPYSDPDTQQILQHDRQGQIQIDATDAMASVSPRSPMRTSVKFCRQNTASSLAGPHIILLIRFWMVFIAMKIILIVTTLFSKATF